MGAPGSRAAQAADEQAWLARDPYPSLAFAGGPAFGVAHELELGGWRLHQFSSCSYPQEARESMGHTFRVLAQRYSEGSAEHAECMRAAEKLDWEALDEMTVLGTRYRVVRAEQFLRTGPLGPEPPRPSDPDPEPPIMQVPDAPEDDGQPVEYSEETKRFIRLFEEEQERRARLQGPAGDPPGD